MLNFDEVKEALNSGNDDWEATKADLETTDSFIDMPEGIGISVFESYFPDTHIWRDNNLIIAEITEHIYLKFWEHKWHGRVYADAMIRAVKRFIAEGHPFSEGNIDNDDEPHIFIRWKICLPVGTSGRDLVSSVDAAYELVCSRADLILENSDSVLLLGKDTEEGMARLRRIEARLQDLGYYTYIIKDEPNRLGETVIQKVMRYALSSKFVIVENTEPSGHLYEIPHVGKAAECVIAFLQEDGKGATWMFEDAFARNHHWMKFVYPEGRIEDSVDNAVTWAENFVRQFGAFQQRVLPWMRPVTPSPTAPAAQHPNPPAKSG